MCIFVEGYELSCDLADSTSETFRLRQMLFMKAYVRLALKYLNLIFLCENILHNKRMELKKCLTSPSKMYNSMKQHALSKHCTPP